jgi:hypothetical protein
MSDTEPDGWERQQDGSYRNAEGWIVHMAAQGLWRIKRPNGFYADQLAYADRETAFRRVVRHARFRVA